MFFYVFGGCTGVAAVTPLHRPSNKSARTPTVASTVWGIKKTKKERQTNKDITNKDITNKQTKT